MPHLGCGDKTDHTRRCSLYEVMEASTHEVLQKRVVVSDPQVPLCLCSPGWASRAHGNIIAPPRSGLNRGQQAGGTVGPCLLG
ncbi:hypothetical protein AAFF_G00228490 [Aldrovandia affinis]|uniref:Uncharacterized protein n=1 Tax=Aldrovandia affinis TaxID=143900 RepID=A0AAD7SVJ9_9TELE|nr:hypothetical protein AAFF_G00228490 [Aldrovandia affinis]